jgi:Mg/Co/Ni transporter MgtE
MSDPNLLSLAFLENKPKAAAALLQELPAEQTVDFLQHIPVDILTPVIDGMTSWPAARALSLLPAELAADILRDLPDSEAETLLRLMSEEQRATVMAHLPASIARDFTRKLVYPLNTVGAWMDISIPNFAMDSSVGHCLDLVKRRQIHLGGIVIVVDYRRHLLGLVEVEKLLTSDDSVQLIELLNTDISPLSPLATLWEVENHEGWTVFPTLPVTDRNNTILGALTHSALREGTQSAMVVPDSSAKFSMVAHLSRAFFIAVGGMLQVVSGVGPGPAGTPGRPLPLIPGKGQERDHGH